MFKFEDFRKAYDTKDYSGFKYERYVFATMFKSVRQNKSFVSMVKLSRQVKARYDKRIVNDDLTTSPIVVDYKEPEDFYVRIHPFIKEMFKDDR
jgi:hypothetical protein